MRRFWNSASYSWGEFPRFTPTSSVEGIKTKELQGNDDIMTSIIMTSLILRLLLRGATASLNNKHTINDVIMTSHSYHVTRMTCSIWHIPVASFQVECVASWLQPSKTAGPIGLGVRWLASLSYTPTCGQFQTWWLPVSLVRDSWRHGKFRQTVSLAGKLCMLCWTRKVHGSAQCPWTGHFQHGVHFTSGYVMFLITRMLSWYIERKLEPEASNWEEI